MAEEFNLASTAPLESHCDDGAKAFAAKIDELSGGSFKVNLKPAGALGGEREVIEGLQIGDHLFRRISALREFVMSN
ncbi:hypothetical protein [Rhizobium miluonense]|uniref:Extracellular solute-binding protein, family 7 n=1 Tax=Rhizobium miluonense TaxID=411945 RepID=A0A1C3V7N2_9HYPH|nr:hypothetical protein [Rhizobium miluonense]SCB23688.1 extracellular solute-binding protein, family 7 [Rhizobium miluonense]